MFTYTIIGRRILSIFPKSTQLVLQFPPTMYHIILCTVCLSFTFQFKCNLCFFFDGVDALRGIMSTYTICHMFYIGLYKENVKKSS